ncbi:MULTISPECIES: hypothetical protein [unclassified Pseudomonas]|uniref:hypothetical protein n=1 Tax=unclassified Pseudomonas TaxID=196821 RepID=UPI00200C13A4|nr:MULTISPECIES: hypothetical protein [unclassified Pseudomonas]
MKHPAANPHSRALQRIHSGIDVPGCFSAETVSVSSLLAKHQAIESKEQLKTGTAFAISFTTLTRASPLKKELQPWGTSIKA